MRKSVLVLALVLLVALPVLAQTPAFQKWDMYAGYSYLNTTSDHVAQHGFNLSFGRNINKWVALGMDFSRHEGDGFLVATGTDMAKRLPSALVSQLGVPSSILNGIKLATPLHATSATFAAGTQFQVRKSKYITPFFRPFLGAFHGTAVGDPTKIGVKHLPAGVTPQAFAAIVGSIPQDTLRKALNQSDTSLGYGVGAGFDINVSRPIGIRLATDYIRTSLFDQDQSNVRIAVGLIYRFGGDVQTK